MPDICVSNVSSGLHQSCLPPGAGNESVSTILQPNDIASTISTNDCNNVCCGNSDCKGRPKGSRPCFMASTVELVYQIFNSGLPNRDGLRIPLSDHSLSADAWEKRLQLYFDRVDILESIKFGWDLGLNLLPVQEMQSSTTQALENLTHMYRSTLIQSLPLAHCRALL